MRRLVIFGMVSQWLEVCNPCSKHLLTILLRFLLNIHLDPVLRTPIVCSEQIRPVENKLELWAYGMDGEQFWGLSILQALHSYLLLPQLCFDSSRTLLVQETGENAYFSSFALNGGKRHARFWCFKRKLRTMVLMVHRSICLIIRQ